MGGVSELLRYGIPGWLFLVYVGGFLAVRSMTQIIFGGIPIPISQVIVQHKDDITAVAVFGAAAGVPIGYVLYQLYWWVSDHLAPYVGLISFDRGAAVLQSVSVPFKELVHRDYEGAIRADYGPTLMGFQHWVVRSQDPPVETILRLQDNKTLANFIWHLLLEKNKAEFVRRRAEYLSDTFHSLGVARIAISCALIVYLILEGLTQPLAIEYVVAVVFNVLIFMIFFRIFSMAREDTRMNLVYLQHDFITYYWPRTELKPSSESD